MTIQNNIADQSQDSPSPVTHKYQVYKYRFLIVILFTMSAVNNVFMWLIWSPIQTLLERTYDESLTYVNFGTILISNIIYLPASIFASYITDTYGLKPGIWLGCILTALGQFCRLYCDNGFVYILIGQIIASFAQPFFYNTPQKVSQVWFPAKERTICTAGLTTALTLAMAAGSVIPLLYVDPDEVDKEVAQRQIKTMMEQLFYFGVACYIPTILLFRNEPPTPPSRAAHAKKPDVGKSMKSLFRNKNYMILLAGSSLVVAGLINTISVMQALIEPWNIGGNPVAKYGGGGIASGLITNVIFGIFVQKTMKFKCLLFCLSFCGIIFLPGCIAGAEYIGTWAWGVIFIAYGGSQSPLLAVGLEFIMEVSFPVAESSAAGLVMIIGGGLSALESVICDTFINHEKEGSLIAIGIMVGVQIVGTGFMFFVKEDLRRHKYEKGELNLGEEDKDIVDPTLVADLKEKGNDLTESML